MSGVCHFVLEGEDAGTERGRRLMDREMEREMDREMASGRRGMSSAAS